MQYRLEGGSLPAVIINLNPGETMISEAGGRTWSRGAVDSTVTTLGGAGKALGRMLMGESLFMNLYTAQEPAGDSLLLLLPRQDSRARAWPRPEHNLPEARLPLRHIRR